MNKMDHDGLIMCRMQGRMFELSLNEEGSSAVFIRRFMNSSLAKRMDRLAFLNTAQSELQALAEIKEEYHNRIYGSEKYDKEELYWTGYLYRYWAYIYGISSDQIYKAVSGSDMRKHYGIYHTLAPEKAIAMLMEEKNYTPAITIAEKEDLSKAIIKEKLSEENNFLKT